MAYIDENGLARVTTNLKTYIDTEIASSNEDDAPAVIMRTISEYNDIQGSVSTVGEYAFYNCKSLSEITLPECSVVSSFAFCGCNKLNGLYLPKCTEIKDYAFSGTYSVSYISLPICNKLNSNTFMYCGVQNLCAPSLTNIGSSAFQYCLSLQSVNLPELYSMSPYAFQSCSNISDVYLPKLFYVGSAAFGSCINLQRADLGNIFNIPDNLFRGCYELSQVIYHKTIREIGSNAFNGCSKLSYFDMSLCYAVGQGAFANCIILKDVNVYPNRVVYANTFNGCSALNSIVLPSGGIGNSCFSRCTSLESVYLPTYSILTGSTNMFYSTPITNESLLGYYGSIYVPSAVVESYKVATNWVSLSDRITQCPASIDSKYVYCREYSGAALTEIPLSKQGVEYVGDYAFSGCAITRVDLPDCLAIRDNAIWGPGTASLVVVNLPKCEFLGIGALYSQYTQHYGFVNLPNLKTLYGPNILYFNTNATSIVVGVNNSFVCDFQTGNGTGMNGKIYVPDNLVSEYKVANGWRNLSARIFGISTLPPFSITTSISNGTITGASEISYSNSATLTISASTGYALPSTITVENATSYTYNNTTGVVDLFGPFYEISISAECVEVI